MNFCVKNSPSGCRYISFVHTWGDSLLLDSFNHKVHTYYLFLVFVGLVMWCIGSQNYKKIEENSSLVSFLLKNWYKQHKLVAYDTSMELGLQPWKNQNTKLPFHISVDLALISHDENPRKTSSVNWTSIGALRN
jgi:hypothetical protein